MAERKKFFLDEVIGNRSPGGQAIPIYFDTGITTRPREHFMSGYGASDPTLWHTYFNDFDAYAAADWTVTEVGSGSRALTDAAGGVLLITNAAADDDHNFFQKVGESFLIVAGKQTFFKARFKVSDATQSDFVLGLLITDTSPLAVSDGIFFQKDDGDANIDFHVEKNSTASDATAIAVAANNTYVTLGFGYDGVSRVYYAVNDVTLGFLPVTNLPDDEELTVSFAMQNGEGVAKTMSLDYILAAQQR